MSARATCVMGDSRIEVTAAEKTSEVGERGACVLIDAAHYDEVKGWTQAGVCLTPEDARRLADELLRLAADAEAA